MKPECSVIGIELPDPQCPVLPFSDWSPCSVSCGKGSQIRTRLLLVEPGMVEMCKQRIQLHQQRPCSERVDCTFDLDTTKGTKMSII
jgi:spondin-1